jgi:hypothetical protein
VTRRSWREIDAATIAAGDAENRGDLMQAVRLWHHVAVLRTRRLRVALACERDNRWQVWAALAAALYCAGRYGAAARCQKRAVALLPRGEAPWQRDYLRRYEEAADEHTH